MTSAAANIPMEAEGRPKHPTRLNFWSLYTMLRFWLLGIRFGPGLRAFGPVLLRIQGSARNIQIGKNVTLLPYADLKVRDSGRIILHDGVFVETTARLLAANDATLEIGAETQIGMGSVITAGDDVRIGRFTAIVASEHRYDGPGRIQRQGYHHAPITIGEDVWIATGVVVRPGVTIGEGAVLGAHSVAHEDVAPYSVAVGNPAQVVKLRPLQL